MMSNIDKVNMMCLRRFALVSLALWVMMVTYTRVVAQPPPACPSPSGATAPTFAYNTEFLSTYDVAGMASGQILTYLNTVGSAEGLAEALRMPISEQTTVSVFDLVTTDITGDTTPEVLINLGIDYGGAFDAVILLYGCSDGVFEQWYAENYRGWSCAPASSEISKIEDINQNRTAEIYFFFVSIAGTSGCWETSRVYEWNGETLKRALWDWRFVGSEGAFQNCGFPGAKKPDPRMTDEEIGHEWRFQDEDNDRIDEILILDYEEAGFSNSYPCVEVWQWQDPTTLHLMCVQRFVTPDMYRAVRVELLATAEDALYCGLDHAAARSYRQVIENEELPEFYSYGDTDQRPYLIAFAYYRLIQISVAAGDLTQAADDYAALRKNFSQGKSGFEYAQMAQVFWEAYEANNDLAAACATVNTYAAERRKPTAGDGTEAFYFMNGYLAFEYDPDNIYSGCPTHFTEMDD